jgi:hypothetical protein
MNCATLSPNSPNNPWDSEVHWMRGLFITTVEANGQGSPIEQATAGDKLLLQARVYNYSLTDMAPDTTTVHVRFYGQPWDASPNHNSPIGNSFLIGEAVTGTIPAFNAQSTAPNWQLVGTTFDTNTFDQTKNGDVYLTFWVVVWMEDASGNLVGEMPGHGLTGIPGTLNSLADAATLEETYSNNVGFYKLAFYVLPPPSSPTAAHVPSKGVRPPVRMGKVEVSAHQVAPDERILVSTTLHIADQPIRGGLIVLFYDGDPAAGGRAFDAERVVYLRAHDTYDVHVPFRASVCGKHDLVVVAGGGTAFEHTRKANLHVKCK